MRMMNQIVVGAALACGVVACGVVLGGCASSSGSASKAPMYSQEQMMQAMMKAATPGEMQQLMQRGVGTWKVQNTMWMSPGSEPMVSEGTIVTEMKLDGRYASSVYKGPMAGMGEFEGHALVGFDNAAGKFVGTWYDNFSTGIMRGEGTLRAGSSASTGTTIDWVYTYFCPITNKPATMRQIDMQPDANTIIMEAFMRDPNTGEEYRGMRMECKRVS
jgi:hypothetical protein